MSGLLSKQQGPLRCRRILYVDLDGTIRYSLSGDFVHKAADVKVYPEARRLLQLYKAVGWRIVAITNQGGVARGYLDLRDCIAALEETNRQCDGVFDRMQFCVHHPEGPNHASRMCWCRKPRIGMLVEAATELALQHGEYYPNYLGLVVGDRPEDRECAVNAGVQFMAAEEWRALRAPWPNEEVVI